MGQKGISADNSGAHFDRIHSMMQKSSLISSDLGLFGPVDVGQNVSWWDYGQLKLYQKNALLLAERYALFKIEYLMQLINNSS